ncbi:MAG: hypothetical protein LBM04_09210 [Opitutaceae bacterium]|jgi:hypothetical protein|nr:hypothetical protein [Opitutaceae bacterium]
MSNTVTALKNNFAFNLAVIVATFAIFALLLLIANQPTPLPIASTSETTAEERAATLAELRAKETAAATTYAWIDRQNGIVRLPLPRAIELTIQDLNP